MTAPHLIGIGRLGGTDAEGWHHVMIRPDYRAGFAHLADLYLIFEENRVFYVTISDRKRTDRKTWVRFAEDGIAEERKLHREVILAIEDSSYEEDEQDLIGLDVVFDGHLLGCAVDQFYNGAHDVLVVSTPLGVEIMIPVVEHYMPEYPAEGSAVLLKNMEDLLLVDSLHLVDGQLNFTEDED